MGSKPPPLGRVEPISWFAGQASFPRCRFGGKHFDAIAFESINICPDSAVQRVFLVSMACSVPVPYDKMFCPYLFNMLFNKMRAVFSSDLTWSLALEPMDLLASLKGLKLRIADMILL